MNGTVGASILCRHTVVEHRNFAEVGVVHGDVVVDPVTVVLIKKLLVFFRPHVIRFGVAPAPEQLSGREIVVVDNPELVKRGHAEQEVLEVGVVVDGVDVQPVAGLAAGRAVVHINLVDAFTDHTKVVFACIQVLDQMVPRVPLPHHIGASVAVRRKL